MTNTTYYNLNQPEPNDSVRVTPFNENADIIDRELYQLATEQAKMIPATDKGAAGGVATLDASGLVPVAQLPLPRVNLIDNPFFLVNQPQKDVYTGNGYTVDRWRLFGGTANSATPTENGIILATTGASSTSAYFAQVFEFPWWLANQTVTLSVLFADVQGTGAAYYGRIDDSGATYAGNKIASSIGAGLSVITRKLVGTTLQVTLGTDNATTTPSSARAVAVKLELGDTQTLARKDANGNWVLLDPPPDFSAELAKCQRFYQIFRAQALRPTYGADFRPAMRINPSLGTISIDGATYYTADGNL